MAPNSLFSLAFSFLIFNHFFEADRARSGHRSALNRCGSAGQCAIVCGRAIDTGERRAHGSTGQGPGTHGRRRRKNLYQLLLEQGGLPHDRVGTWDAEHAEEDKQNVLAWSVALPPVVGAIACWRLPNRHIVDIPRASKHGEGLLVLRKDLPTDQVEALRQGPFDAYESVRIWLRPELSQPFFLFGRRHLALRARSRTVLLNPFRYTLLPSFLHAHRPTFVEFFKKGKLQMRCHFRHFVTNEMFISPITSFEMFFWHLITNEMFILVK